MNKPSDINHGMSMKLKPCPLRHHDKYIPLLEEIHNGDGETPNGFRVICYGCMLVLSGRRTTIHNTKRKKWFKYDKKDREYHETKESLSQRWNHRSEEGSEG